MEALTARLLNNYQRDFPLTSTPFATIARALRTDSATVIARLRQLQAHGAVSRVGPVFRPNTVGVSTLAAMAVPADRLESVASAVNAFVQVNHNYEREHRYNLWFVATAADEGELHDTLRRIEKHCGYPVLSLPLVRDYHIDLGFHMQLGSMLPAVPGNPGIGGAAPAMAGPAAAAEDLIEAVQDGLPLVEEPYRRLAQQLGWSESKVIAELQGMLNKGVIKRLGVVVRHHELGYNANAMVVWNVPDASIDRLGYRLGRQACVTLCYQRPRALPDWPYNLFCMVHGRNRDDVIACIRRMTEELALGDIDKAILFSRRRFKQRGARYRVRADG